MYALSGVRKEIVSSLSEKMMLQLLHILLVGFTFGGTRVRGLVFGECVTEAMHYCSQYKVCIEAEDKYLYPGRMKTLVYDLYLPQGLTYIASMNFVTPSAMTVAIMGAYVDLLNDTLTTTTEVYRRMLTTTLEGRASYSTRAEYSFGNIDCKSNDKDPCTVCQMHVSVEYLLANIADVSENPKVRANLVSDNVTIAVGTTLELRLQNNSSRTSNFSTDIPGTVGFPRGSFKKFQIHAMFRNPLSQYTLVISSPTNDIRIVWVRIVSIGENFKDILSVSPLKRSLEDDSFCDIGPDTRTLNFGYVPNKGAFDPDNCGIPDLIGFEVLLFMTNNAVNGNIYSLNVHLEVDNTEVMRTTKFFNSTFYSPIQKVNVTSIQKSPVLPKGGSSYAKLTLDIPAFSRGKFRFKASTMHYAGPGEDGLVLAAVEIEEIGGDLQCMIPSKHWKLKDTGQTTVTSIPYGKNVTSSTLSFYVRVFAAPHLVEAHSSHELTFILTHDGEGSPQKFKFYFNITEQEIYTVPNSYGKIPMQFYFYEQCPSMSSSTDVILTLHTKYGQDYGHLLVEILPTGSTGDSVFICDFGRVFKGYNIFGDFRTNITKRSDGMIEKVIIDISPLTNIYLATLDGVTVNLITMNMVVIFYGNGNNDLLPSLKARVISNNNTIWTEELKLHKAEYYPNFIVVTEIMRAYEVNEQNIWFVYSLNGTSYHRDSIGWETDNNVYRFDAPKVVNSYHFLTETCSAICKFSINATWFPLSDYITIVKDPNNIMLRLIPYALDQDVDTCFDLPVPGDFPSMLWLRIKDLNLFGVTSKKYVVHMTGEGIECTRVGRNSIQVGTTGQAQNDKCSIESDIVFCKVVSHQANSTQTRCDIACECENLQQCSNVHVIIQSASKNTWRLCELTITDAI